MDLMKLFDRYNIFARIAPAFLFSYFTLLIFGVNLLFLSNVNSFIFVSLVLFALYPLSMFASIASKKVETFVWNKYGNPIIVCLKKRDLQLYNNLLSEHNNNDGIVKFLLGTTRPDEKVFWKNVTYGFFRNALPLSIVFTVISFFTPYFYYACIWLVANVLAIIGSTRYFANQVIDSYLEIQATSIK